MHNINKQIKHEIILFCKKVQMYLKDIVINNVH